MVIIFAPKLRSCLDVVGFTSIHMHVLKWIGMKLKLNYTSIHTWIEVNTTTSKQVPRTANAACRAHDRLSTPLAAGRPRATYMPRRACVSSVRLARPRARRVDESRRHDIHDWAARASGRRRGPIEPRQPHVPADAWLRSRRKRRDLHCVQTVLLGQQRIYDI